MPGIGVVVLGHSPIFVRGLVASLEAEEGIEVLGTASPNAGAEHIAEHAPDVIVCVHTPEVDLESIVHDAGDRPVLVVGTTGSNVIDAVRAGAAGYVGSNEATGYVALTVSALAAGRSVYPAHWFDPAATVFDEGPHHDVELTRRDRDLIELIVDGLSNKEIARALGVAPQTVKNRLGQVMLKVGVSSRVQLYRWAQSHGIKRPPPETAE